MNMQNTILKALGFTLVATSLVACGNEPVDNEETNEAVTTNLQAMSRATENNIRVMTESDFFWMAEGSVFGESSEDACVDNGDGFCDSFEPEPEPEYDAEFRAASDEMIRFLEEDVFIPANVEEESRKEITYLIKGSSVCDTLAGGDAAEGYGDCVSAVDSAQLRLVVTSPNEGDVSIDVLLGPDRHNPVSVDIWSDTLAAEFDLGGIRSSAIFLADTFEQGEVADEFPDVFQGRVRASLTRQGEQQLTVGFGVKEAVQVKDEALGYDVRVAVAADAATMSMDATAKTITSGVNWNAIDLQFPQTDIVYGAPEPSDPNDPFDQSFDEGEEVTHDIKLHFDGLKGKTVLDVANEIVELKGISLGNGPATLDIDNNRVLDVTLADAFDVTIKEESEGVTTAAFAPGMDLNILFNFASAMQAAEDYGVDEWMLSEDLSISLTGTTPTLRLTDSDQIEVTSGTLSLEAKEYGADITVEANQCLIGEEADVCTFEEGGEESCGEYDSHPFAHLTSGACQ